MTTDPRPDAEALLANAAWVRDLARKILRDADAADDVVQDAFAAALTRPRRAGVPLANWLARVARNLSIQRMRTDSRRAKREQSAAGPSSAEPPDEGAARAERFRDVVDAVLALEPPYRDVVLRRFFDGLDVAQIAARLGVPEATVRTRLKRAIAMLRARLERRHGDRGAWALLILGRDEALRASPVGAAAASAIGGVVMAKYAFAAVLVALLLLGGWYVLDDAATTAPTAPTVVADAAHSSTSTTNSAPKTSAAEKTQQTVDAPKTEPADAKVPTIRGFVHALGGGPIDGATVELVRTPPGGDRMALATTRTDPTGKFALKASAWRPDAAVVASAPGRAVARGTAAPGGYVDLALTVGATLRGRVFDETTGESIAGAVVVAGSLDALVERVEERTTTTSDGTYEVTHLLPWTTYVSVSAAGHVTESANVVVRAGAATTFDVAVRRGGTITGRVTRAGKPVAGARVAIRSWPHDGAAVVTDADGAYSLSGFAGDGALGPEGLVVTADGPLHKDVMLPRTRDRELRVDVDLTDCWTIRGVIRSGGAPAARARVAQATWLGIAGLGLRFVETGDDGAFVIAANERDPCELDAESFDGIQTGHAKVPRPRDGNVADGVVIDLCEPIEARARIVSAADGSPIAGATSSWSVSGDDGVIRVRTSRWRGTMIVFAAPGYASAWREMKFDGASVDLGDVALAKPKAGFIAGHVRALDGTPMASVPVEAVWSHDDVGRALTADDGSFRIDGLPAKGAGSVQARFPGMTSYKHEGVESGDSDVNLELASLAPALAVLVTRSDGMPSHGFSITGYVRREGDGGRETFERLWTASVRQPDGRFASTEWPWIQSSVTELEVVDGDEIGRAPLKLVDGQTVDVRVKLASGCRIHGRVGVPGGGPAVRALVSVARDGEGWNNLPANRVARTDAGGRFDVGPLVAGAYRVAIVDERGAFPRRVVAADVRVGEYVDVNETLSAGGVKVRVVDDDDRPVAGATAYLLDAAGAPAFYRASMSHADNDLGSTSADGSLVATRIDPGKYRVRVSRPNQPESKSVVADVEIRADETADVVVKLPR
jgi:RNA polymerase sigma-70 factor (ECF subfamily)